jgi:serine/threonine-protein kinase
MKPENIFVLKSSIDAVGKGESRQLAVKVLDFGISKAGGGERTHLTKTGVIMGTPSYMSPEQARGKDVDFRADIYSVGACLYYMITGQRPFDTEDPTVTIGMVLTQDPQRPREIDPRIPEGLELIVQRAMAKDVADRHQSMFELARALEGFLRASRTAIDTGAQPLLIPQADLKDLAKTALGSPSIPPAASAGAAATSEAKLARPTVVGASVALGFWFVGGTVSALGGLVRVLHNGEMTVTESVLLLVGCLFAAATPIGLYVSHLRKKIWPNSVRAVQLATDLRRFTGAAFLSYGALTLVGRLTHTIFLRSSSRLASGVWDMALFGVSVVLALSIGGFAPLVRNSRRRRSSDST